MRQDKNDDQHLPDLLNCGLNRPNGHRAGGTPGPVALADNSSFEVQAMAFFRRQHGQAGLEYLLVVGAMVVALIIALQTIAPPAVQTVAGVMCPSVDTAVPTPVPPGSCVVMAPPPP